MDFGSLTAVAPVAIITANRTPSKRKDKPNVKPLGSEKVVYSPTRETKEQTNTTRISNLDLSMYKKVYCGCSKCNTERVHIIKGNTVNCTYCDTFYYFTVNKPVREDNFLFF